ncbi:MAG: FGGY-family carbohydrate kinase [Treponemataceae bacterium]
MECVFVCDAGTSSLKTALISADGSIVKESRFYFTQKLTAEYYLKHLLIAFDKMQNFAKTQRIKIAGICISGNGPSLVASFNVKTDDKLLLWNEDCSKLKLNEKEKSFYCQLKNSGSIFLPRLFLFVKKYSAQIQNAKYILPLPEYLSYKLTGKAFVFLPEARYTKAYWSKVAIKKCESFFAENLSLLFFNEKIPTFVNAGQVIGSYAGIPVIAGAPDFFVALLGTKTIKPFYACDRAGTSEGINLCLNFKPDGKNKFRVLPSPLQEHWNISALLGETGMLSKNTNESLATIANITDLQKLKANKNLIAFFTEFKNSIKELEEIAKTKLDFVLTGGQARNSNLNQAKANITGRKFYLTQTFNAELLGAAILAFTALNYFPNLEIASEAIVKITKVFEPKA